VEAPGQLPSLPPPPSNPALDALREKNYVELSHWSAAAAAVNRCIILCSAGLLEVYLVAKRIAVEMKTVCEY